MHFHSVKQSIDSLKWKLLSPAKLFATPWNTPWNSPGQNIGVGYHEGWAPKNWCFWTAVLEKTLGCPLDCKEIQPVHPKEDQSWVFIGRTDAEAEAPILWPLDVKSWLIGKDPDAGEDYGQEEKGTAEDEMVWWHHWLKGHGFVWTLGVGDGQGGLACCGSWGSKDMTEQLNWTEPFPFPGDLSNPGIKPRSPTLQVDSLPAEPPGYNEACIIIIFIFQMRKIMCTEIHCFLLGHTAMKRQNWGKRQGSWSHALWDELSWGCWLVRNILPGN